MDPCYTDGFRGELSVLMSGVDLPPAWSARETPGLLRVPLRDRKVEIFIPNAACKVRGAPPLQVIFMGLPRSNELIFTFYAFRVPSARRTSPFSSLTIKTVLLNALVLCIARKHIEKPACILQLKHPLSVMLYRLRGSLPSSRKIQGGFEKRGREARSRDATNCSFLYSFFARTLAIHEPNFSRYYRVGRADARPDFSPLTILADTLSLARPSRGKRQFPRRRCLGMTNSHAVRSRSMARDTARNCLRAVKQFRRVCAPTSDGENISAVFTGASRPDDPDFPSNSCLSLYNLHCHRQVRSAHGLRAEKSQRKINRTVGTS